MQMAILPESESIFYVKQLISKDLCARIIDNYVRDPRKRNGCTVGGRGQSRLQHEVKVSTDLEFVPEGEWTQAFNELNGAVNTALENLVAQVPSLQVWPLWWTGYKIQHYTKNQGYFKWHFDALGPGTWDRQLAMVIYLNSVDAGGETCFHRQNLKFKPIAGDALIFPTFWTHAHCGEVPVSEDKYIISSFISFDIPAVEQPTA
jgi:hypothetical protein